MAMIMARIGRCTSSAVISTIFGSMNYTTASDRLIMTGTTVISAFRASLVFSRMYTIRLMMEYSLGSGNNVGNIRMLY
jgi:hypothetical protein